MEIIKRSEAEELSREGYKVKKLLSFKFNKNIDSAVFYETTIPVGGSFKEQWHNESYEMIYFITSGKASINGKEIKFNVGDLLMMSPVEKHSFKAIEKDLVLLAIRFPDLPNDKFT